MSLKAQNKKNPFVTFTSRCICWWSACPRAGTRVPCRCGVYRVGVYCCAVYAVYAVSSLDTSLPLRHRTRQRRRDELGSCRARSPALHVGRRDRVASYGHVHRTRMLIYGRPYESELLPLTPSASSAWCNSDPNFPALLPVWQQGWASPVWAGLRQSGLRCHTATGITSLRCGVPVCHVHFIYLSLRRLGLEKVISLRSATSLLVAGIGLPGGREGEPQEGSAPPSA